MFGEYALRGATLLPELTTGYDLVHEHLKSKVIGQDQAIDAIMNALDRADVRMSDDNRPIANFAFLGPTGVGKTQTAKALAEALAVDETRLIKIDCSSFSHGHEIASLLGSPPGYVGQNREPLLRTEVVENEGVVVLFDEIEKGSDELNNLLLQIMDDGEITLHNGEVVSFRDTTLIVTSNLGAREMSRQASGARTGFSIDAPQESDKTTLETVALKEFKQFFRPEFVNRFDDLVVFHALDQEALHAVLDTKLSTMNAMYQDNYGARISLSLEVRQYLVEKALSDAGYGARPLVRALEKDIASTFGRYIAHESIEEGTEVRVFHRDELGDAVPATYKSDLVFTARPDYSIVKKPVYVPEPDEPVYQAAVTSTELIRAPQPILED